MTVITEGDDAKQVFVPHWQPIRDAIEFAYGKLDLQQIASPDGNGAHYNTTHWNIAAMVHQYVLEQGSATCKCISCPTRLNVHTAFRCFDCKAALCEFCAPGHFGPKHGERAAAAHPTK